MAKRPVKVRIVVADIDMGWGSMVTENKNLKGAYTTIGIHEEAGTHPSRGNIHTAGVGFINEFGSGNIPERSFIRSTIDEQSGRIVQLVAENLDQVNTKKLPAKTMLARLGLFVQEVIKNKINTLSDPPNAPFTIAKKGFNNPLIDTRHMQDNITFKVSVPETRNFFGSIRQEAETFGSEATPSDT